MEGIDLVFESPWMQYLLEYRLFAALLVVVTIIPIYGLLRIAAAYPHVPSVKFEVPAASSTRLMQELLRAMRMMEVVQSREDKCRARIRLQDSVLALYKRHQSKKYAQNIQVSAAISRARAAQDEWRHSSFSQRKRMMLIMNKAMLEHAEIILQDSGKPMVDAAFGELMVTCEKALWLARRGQNVLSPEYREPGIMMFYKKCRVEFMPRGVVGAIVPWNYPFHNIFNPLLAALFAGNGIIIKASEHASWSAQFYQRLIDAILLAGGAPEGLVQIVTGGEETGRAMVQGGTDMVIFIGSTGVGRAVMRDAADTLTPVTLELGGKDPFIICGDTKVEAVVPVALRAAFQSSGQNCVAAERFIVHQAIYDKFLEQCTAVAKRLRQGNPLGSEVVDCGAMCLPGLAGKVHELVEDAVAKGARVLAGGHLMDGGHYYPPTILADVTTDMRVWKEETFGPLMTVTKCTSDEHAVELANDCQFGLGSACFSASQPRAVAIGKQINAGMFVVNDFASNAMCQSLPFGGIKESGFDRFGGVEGLRGMCYPKVMLEDRWPLFMRTDIPPPLRYPVAGYSFEFVHSLCKMFYGSSICMQLSGLCNLARLAMFPPQDKGKTA